MIVNFKFDIGQTVEHISSAEWRAEKTDSQVEDLVNRWGSRSDQRWFIVERYSQECPGGVQKHYVCRGVGFGSIVTKEYFKFNEIELVAIKPK